MTGKDSVIDFYTQSYEKKKKMLPCPTSKIVVKRALKTIQQTLDGAILSLNVAI